MDKLVKRNKIFLRDGKVVKIAQKVGCSQAAVFNALSYRTNSELAVKIRKVAIEDFGGIIGRRDELMVDED